MNFTHSDADKSKIIKEMKYSGCKYSITYLDGKSTEYINSDKGELQKLKKIMIDQAIERQNKININHLSLKKGLSIMSSIALLEGYILTKGVDNSNLTLLLILLLMICCYSFKNNSKKIRELKKYKLFLEMIDDIDYINSKNVIKAIDHEKIYQTPLDINTLDQYSYSNLKVIKKQLKKQKTIKN